jgi:hypothetical protein
MTLLDLLEDELTGIEEIAAHLDRSAPQARAADVLALDRAGQRALYERAVRSIDLEHFVPPRVAPQQTVRHRGRNTLPLPARLKLFEKRFSRPDDGSARLFGYNESPFKRSVGPGFFVAYATASRPAWSERGGVVVDYFQVPDGPVPDGWGEVVPNSRGLSRFVYDGTRDFMRVVSAHVSVGAAYKGEKKLDHYFVLVREDP